MRFEEKSQNVENNVENTVLWIKSKCWDYKADL